MTRWSSRLVDPERCPPGPYTTFRDSNSEWRRSRVGRGVRSVRDDDFRAYPPVRMDLGSELQVNWTFTCREDEAGSASLVKSLRISTLPQTDSASDSNGRPR